MLTHCVFFHSWNQSNAFLKEIGIEIWPGLNFFYTTRNSVVVFFFKHKYQLTGDQLQREIFSRKLSNYSMHRCDSRLLVNYVRVTLHLHPRTMQKVIAPHRKLLFSRSLMGLTFALESLGVSHEITFTFLQSVRALSYIHFISNRNSLLPRHLNWTLKAPSS